MFLQSWLLVLPALFIAHARSATAPSPALQSPKAAQAAAADTFFKDGRVLNVRIEISQEGISKLRRAGWGGGDSQRPRVKATVRESDKIYTNVEVHIKGAAGSFRPIDANPCLTLNFDKFAKGQRFHGLQKISLNNSVQDPTFLTERICRQLFDAAGVPAPRAGHATLDLNGRDLGLYVLTEGFNKQFVGRYFKNNKGNLYDGGFLREITDGLEKTSGDDPQDQSDLQRLAAAASEPDPVKRIASLERVLDLDRFISLIAMEVMTWHWDGYAMKKNNYRVYHDLDTDRMVFFPHGLDQMFWEPNGLILPRMEGGVARAVVQTPEGRRRYLERMSQLLTNVFKVEAITNEVRRIEAQIHPVIARRNPAAANYHAREVTALCERIAQRAQSIRKQLSTPTLTQKFDSTGVARLNGWRSKTDSGNLNFSQFADGNGRKLRIAAPQGGIGSWRLGVPLPPGHYRFEGRAKTLGVVANPADPYGGVCLRISGQRISQRLAGTADWNNVTFEFDVEASMTEVVLVAELRAARGEVWFDQDSLRLVRK